MDTSYLSKLESLDLGEQPLPLELLISSEGRYETYYAPFEYVNPEARLVICGITPGVSQARVALLTAQKGLREARPDVLKISKHAASFAGAMRKNLVTLLDHIGLQDLLGVDSAARLFENRQDLVHFTSALRNPVLDRGENYSGGSSLVNNPYLWSMARAGLREEIELLSEDSIFIPMGKGVDTVFERLISEGIISRKRILFGLPHASGANSERIAYFCGRKERRQLSKQTNADDLDRRCERLIEQVQEMDNSLRERGTYEHSLSGGIVRNERAKQLSEALAAKRSPRVKRIYALGRIKERNGVIFEAKQNREGMYVLNRKESSPGKGNTTNRARNKVPVASLDEVAELLATGEFLVHLVSECGVRALRHREKVNIEYV